MKFSLTIKGENVGIDLGFDRVVRGVRVLRDNDSRSRALIGGATN